MKYDHFSMLPEKAFQPRNGRSSMTLEGGGSAPAQPSQVTQLTIPEYAQPYMEETLGVASELMKAPYQTYGGARIAGPTGIQQQARAETAGLQTPGQFATGTGMAGAGGLQALSAGQNYMGMATDPGMTQAFMSPYMQNVVDIQKQAAAREAQGAQMQANLAAGRRPGAISGAAQAIGQAERERGLLSRMNEIQAAGSQKAFEAAQQAQQFGSTLGLQGAQTGIQAGQTLGQIGTAQQQADLARLQAQEQAGGRTQAEQQAALDTAYQDFLAQQRYPYSQIGFMSDLLRGSANLAQSGGRAIYDAPASPLSQAAGLGLAGLGMYNMTK